MAIAMLHKAIVTEMIVTRLPRSAHRAMGIPNRIEQCEGNAGKQAQLRIAQLQLGLEVFQNDAQCQAIHIVEGQDDHQQQQQVAVAVNPSRQAVTRR